MKIEINFVIENSVDATRIDDNLRKLIESGSEEPTVAKQVHSEFSGLVEKFSMGKDINGKAIRANVKSIKVYANNECESPFSVWSDNE